MDKFKAKIKKRLYILIMTLLILLISFFVLYFNQSKLSSMSENILGFNAGVMASIGFLLLINILKYRKAMQSHNGLKNLYIQENDERKMYILQKTGSLGINVCLFSLGFATMISGFFNEVVFFTLAATTIFTALVKASFKIYFYKNI